MFIHKINVRVYTYIVDRVSGCPALQTAEVGTLNNFHLLWSTKYKLCKHVHTLYMYMCVYVYIQFMDQVGVLLM